MILNTYCMYAGVGCCVGGPTVFDVMHGCDYRLYALDVTTACVTAACVNAACVNAACATAACATAACATVACATVACVTTACEDVTECECDVGGL